MLLSALIYKHRILPRRAWAMAISYAGVLLVFRRSFADYLWRLIERTAKPYHPCIAAPAAVADPVFTPLLNA